MEGGCQIQAISKPDSLNWALSELGKALHRSLHFKWPARYMMDADDRQACPYENAIYVKDMPSSR